MKCERYEKAIKDKCDLKSFGFQMYGKQLAVLEESLQNKLEEFDLAVENNDSEKIVELLIDIRNLDKIKMLTEFSIDSHGLVETR